MAHAAVDVDVRVLDASDEAGFRGEGRVVFVGVEIKEEGPRGVGGVIGAAHGDFPETHVRFADIDVVFGVGSTGGDGADFVHQAGDAEVGTGVGGVIVDWTSGNGCKLDETVVHVGMDFTGREFALIGDCVTSLVFGVPEVALIRRTVTRCVARWSDWRTLSQGEEGLQLAYS